MAERSSSPAIRGTRLGGSLSFEDDRDEMQFEPRRRHTYLCMLGHQTSVTFHAAAVAPVEWDCGVCPGTARHEDHLADEIAAVPKSGKTHMEQLRGRRTEEELEALLAEAVSNLRQLGRAF